MKEIIKTDARKIREFHRAGYDYTKDKETSDFMIWSVRFEGKHIGWEIWKPKWRINPDGNKVWAKPSDEDFGKYGWYCTNIEGVRKRLNKLTDRDYICKWGKWWETGDWEQEEP